MLRRSAIFGTACIVAGVAILQFADMPVLRIAAYAAMLIGAIAVIASASTALIVAMAPKTTKDKS